MSEYMPPLPPIPPDNVPPGAVTPPLSWSEAWIKALTRPNLESYEEIANSSSVNTNTALTWVFVATLIGFVVEIVAALVFNTGQTGYYAGGATLTNTTGSSFISLCCAPVGAIIAVVVFAIVNGITHLIARALGGTGKYEQLVYTVGAYSAPLTIISAVLYSIPCVGLFNIVLGIYGIVLNVIAVKAVHRFGWGQAILSSIAIWIILVIFVAVVVIVVLALLGPSIGNIFSNITTNL